MSWIRRAAFLSFFSRLALSYIVLVVVGVAAFGYFQSEQVERAARARVDASLRSHAIAVSDLFESLFTGSEEARARMRRSLETLGENLETQITVIAADGRVLADSKGDPARMDNHALRPEIQAARRTGLEGRATRFSGTVQREMRYYAHPVFTATKDRRLRGYVRTARAETQVEESVAALKQRVLWTAILAAIAASVLAWVMAKRITRPLSAVKAAAADLSTGDYSARVDIVGRDDLAELGQAFNGMARELETRVELMRNDQTKLKTILEGMVEGVVAIDDDECVLHVNKVAAQWLGIPDESSVLGQKLWAQSSCVEVSESLSRTMRDEAEERSEITIYQGPEERILEIAAAPLRDANRQVMGAVVVLHDVTKLRKLERVRRDFVGNVSHELKTPLTVIQGIIETMIEDPEMEEELRERFLHKVAKQTGRLSSLVGDLLVLSRVEEQATGIDREPVDLVQLARQAVTDLQEQAAQRGVALQTALPDLPCVVLGDSEGLRQVLGNLLDNAIKYSPEGGRVDISIAREETALCLEVKDEGPGIAAEEQERVFERFYRVDKARSRELGGTGLGLSIVKNIVKTLGGDVGVESEPGRGSSFWVRFETSSNLTAP